LTSTVATVLPQGRKMGRTKKHNKGSEHNSNTKKYKKNKKMTPEDEELFVSEIKELQSRGEPISWCKIDEKLFDRKYGVNFLYQKYNRCMKYKDNQILWTPSKELELLVLVERNIDPVTGKISWQGIIRHNNFEHCASTAQLSNRYKTICRDANLIKEFQEMSEEKKQELVEQGNELRMKTYKQAVSFPSTARKSRLVALKNVMSVDELEMDKENYDPNAPTSKKYGKRKKTDDTLFVPNVADSKVNIGERRVTRSQSARINQQANKSAANEWGEIKDELEEIDSSSVTSSPEKVEGIKAKKQRTDLLLSELSIKSDGNDMESFVSKLNCRNEEKNLFDKVENLRENSNDVTCPDISWDIRSGFVTVEEVSSMDAQYHGIQIIKKQKASNRSLELEVDIEYSEVIEELKEQEKDGTDYKIASQNKMVQGILKKKAMEPSIDDLDAVFSDSNDSNLFHPSISYSLFNGNGYIWSHLSIASKYNTDVSFKEEEVLEEQPTAPAISSTNIDIYFNENI
jgi:hypothetical protein